MFVSFEGIEGSGKSTVVGSLAQLLQADHLKVGLLRDFAAPELHKPVVDAECRSLFFTHGFKYGPRAALFYMLYHEVVKWECAVAQEWDVLLADRFVDSVVVYQGQFLHESPSRDPAALVGDIERAMQQVAIPMPDVTYLLDVPLELSASRFAIREKRNFTEYEIEQLMQIRTALLALADSERRIVRVDAGQPLDNVVGIIHEDIRQRLAQQRMVPHVTVSRSGGWRETGTPHIPVARPSARRSCGSSGF